MSWLSKIKEFFTLCQNSADAGSPTCIRLKCMKGAVGSYGCYLYPNEAIHIYKMMENNATCLDIRYPDAPDGTPALLDSAASAFMKSLIESGTGVKILHNITDPDIIQAEQKGENLARLAYGDRVEDFTTYSKDFKSFTLTPLSSCKDLRFNVTIPDDQNQKIRSLPKIYAIPSYPCETTLLQYAETENRVFDNAQKRKINTDEIIVQLVTAVRLLHVKGFHKDIKLENVAICGDRVKLLDFGFSCLRGETNRFLGTDGYIYNDPRKNHLRYIDFESVNRQALEQALQTIFGKLEKNDADKNMLMNDMFAVGVVSILLKTYVEKVYANKEYIDALIKYIGAVYNKASPGGMLGGYIEPNARRRWVPSGRKTTGPRARLLWRNVETGELRTKRMVSIGGRRVAEFVVIDGRDSAAPSVPPAGCSCSVPRCYKCRPAAASDTVSPSASPSRRRRAAASRRSP